MAQKKSKVDLTCVDVPAKESGRDKPLFSGYAEAPGQDEMKSGEPLTGSAGKIFNFILYRLGIWRRDVRLDNFCQTQLPNNNTDLLWKITPKGRFKTDDAWPVLTERFFNSLENDPSNIIILFGATPLVGFAGPDFASIEQYRGYHWDWKGKLVMPTYHPAAAMPGRAPHLSHIIFADILKAMRIEREGRRASIWTVYTPQKGFREVSL